MKFNFKKISAITSSILLTGMTMGVAAAANYPQPFVVGSSADVAVVYGTGTGVSALDVVQAGNIQSNLQSSMGASTGATTETVTGGDAASLASGSDLLYLLDDLGENVQTLTKDDLSTVLADGTFADNDGTEYDYEQTISVATNTQNRLSFGNSDNDFDDPTVMIELSKDNTIYTLTVTFDKAVPLNATASEGEEITFFGKTYTIGTATDGDTLVLLGGADSTTINVGETVPMTVSGVTYDVTLNGLSDATTSVASISINGETKTFTQGQTKKIGDVDVYVKTVFRVGDNNGHIEIELGSEKITFESTSAVTQGTENDDIEGTTVTLTTGAPSVNMHSLTKIQVAVDAPDNDENHLLAGESFADPVFGTVKIDFPSVTNGPVFTAEEDTGRTALKVKSGGSRELEVELTDSTGVTKTIPFVFEDLQQDDSRDPFHAVEGVNMTDNDFFILNSGDYEHVMQMNKVNIAAGTTSDVWIKDLFTGTVHKVDNKNFDYPGQNITINNQKYTITNTTLVSSVYVIRAGASASDTRALFPYIELVAGEDYPRVTFANTTNNIQYNGTTTGDNITTVLNATAVAGRIYEVPTGRIQFQLTDLDTGQLAAGVNVSYLDYRVDTGSGWGSYANVSSANIGSVNGINHTTLAVGEAYYTFGITVAGLNVTSVVFNNVTLEGSGTTLAASTTDATATDSMIRSPAVLYVEDKDKSDSEARNTILLNTSDDGSYTEVLSVLFSGTSQYDTQAWDETKLTGYLTNWGTYVLKDQLDSNQNIARLTYPTDQMYANVYFAEEGAVVTPGAATGGTAQLGDILVKDSGVSSVSSKNLIIVGGSCINSAAATVLGGAYCGAAFTDATNVGSGEYMIKSVSDAYTTGKIALVVAGYEAADTVNAATYLRTQTVDTSAEYKGTSTTSATLVTSAA